MFYGLLTLATVLIGFTCPAITVVTVILRALDRIRGKTLGLLGSGSPPYGGVTFESHRAHVVSDGVDVQPLEHRGGANTPSSGLP